MEEKGLRDFFEGAPAGELFRIRTVDLTVRDGERCSHLRVPNITLYCPQCDTEGRVFVPIEDDNEMSFSIDEPEVYCNAVFLRYECAICHARKMYAIHFAIIYAVEKDAEGSQIITVKDLRCCKIGEVPCLAESHRPSLELARFIESGP